MDGGAHDDCGCGGSCDGAACRLPVGRSPLPTVDPAAWGTRRRRALRRAAGTRTADRDSPRRISVLMLDVGGVVIPSLFESVSLAGFPSGPLTDETTWGEVQRGETTERDYWTAVAAERPGLDIGGLWRACSHVRDELRRSLDALAERVRLVAFTNDMAHFFGERWPERFPELRAFDAIVEASRLGVHKPDPDAFRAAAAWVGERPDRCLFVDDLQANLDGAQRAGMHARLFDVRDPGGSVRRVLEDLDLALQPPARPVGAFRRPAADPGPTAAFAVSPGQRPGAPSAFRRGAR